VPDMDREADDRGGGGRRSLVLAVLLACAGSSVSCLNYHLVHPKHVPPSVVTRANEVKSGPLLIHLEWAFPAGPGPFPTVLVHADAGHRARHMRGVIWDLASRGYLAVAADYRRMIRGKYRRSLFAWRGDSDTTAALEVVRSDPRVDGSRLAAMGFSQGGVFSLLMAAQAPDIRAVVAYYPVTDFEHWLSRPQPNVWRRLEFHAIGSYFRRQSGAHDDAEFQQMLDRASPLDQAPSIRASVLLVHGDRDATAPLEESERLANRLRELGRNVDLLVIHDADHVFNFKDRAKASEAWEATLAWLRRCLEDPWKP
jgi:carboxymethylenebutenolidase